MIVLDTNLLVYAAMPTMKDHAGAYKWLNQKLNDTERIGLPWSSLLGYLRIVTNPRAFPDAVPIDEAWELVEFWLNCPNTVVVVPGDDHARILKKLLLSSVCGGNLVPDAHLAALAVEHGATLCSADGDFARFKGLRWVNPIASA